MKKKLQLSRNEQLVILALLILSFVPSIGGSFRLVEMGLDQPFLPENPRLEASPVPIVIHIVGSVLFSLLGIFQFLPSMRKAYPKWHRISGRVFIVAGVIAGITGLWMTHFYEFSEQLQGNLLYWVRIVVGTAMITGILLGFISAIEKNFREHQAWMMRSYALGQGAGMQVFTGILWFIFAQEATGLTRDILMTSSWIINIAIAEWIIYKMDNGRQ